MTQLKITWTENGDDPKSFEDMYDTDFLTLAEAREIKKWTTLNPIKWLEDMDDADNVTAMICLLRRRSGENELRFSEVDFNYHSFKVQLIIPDVDEDAKPDPSAADSI